MKRSTGRLALAAGLVSLALTLVLFATAGKSVAQPGGNPFEAILAKLDEIAASVSAIASDLGDAADGISDLGDKLDTLIGGAESPWQRTLGFNLPVGGGPPAPPLNFEDSFAVPDGKRLVIEYVSTAIRHLPNQPSQEMYEVPPPFEPSLVTTVNGATATHHFPLPDATRHEGANFNGAQWTFAGPVRIYADAGTNVTFKLFRSSNGFGGDARMTLSGRLVDL